MGKAQRDKGKRGEREVASILREAGFGDARRTAQFCGNTGDASDVIGVPGYHIEVKRCESIRLMEWLEQAEHDAAAKKSVPALIFRRSKQPWRVVITLDAFIALLQGKAAESPVGDAAPSEGKRSSKNKACNTGAIQHVATPYKRRSRKELSPNDKKQLEEVSG